MTVQEKVTLVQLFLRGQGVKDLAIFFACSEQTVQLVLREAIQQLTVLNEKLGMRINATPPRIEVTDVVGTMGAGGDHPVTIQES